jgi:tripartite-type tricarboxylate transporter receptor subunit TctC
MCQQFDLQEESMTSRNLIRACAFFALVVGGVTADAQAYPDRPIHLVTGFSAGGIADAVSRVIAQHLGTELGQPVVVENKPGADGQIALSQLSSAAPNGYTIGLADSGMAVNAVLYSNKSYDPIKDFTPLGYIGEVPNFIAVTPSLSARTLSEFIAYAKANPGKMNYAATASSTWLMTERFKAAAGVDLMRIPYTGQAQGLPALMVGDVQMMISAVGPLVPLAKQGKLRPLAVTATRRSWLTPDVPTTTEAGYPDMVYVNWYVILGPAGMPRPLADRITASLRKVLGEPAVASKLRDMGIEPGTMSADEFTTMLKSELAKMHEIAKAANIKID